MIGIAFDKKHPKKNGRSLKKFARIAKFIWKPQGKNHCKCAQMVHKKCVYSKIWRGAGLIWRGNDVAPWAAGRPRLSNQNFYLQCRWWRCLWNKKISRRLIVGKRKILFWIGSCFCLRPFFCLTDDASPKLANRCLLDHQSVVLLAILMTLLLFNSYFKPVGFYLYVIDGA